jgi:hypothetical protein
MTTPLFCLAQTSDSDHSDSNTLTLLPQNAPPLHGCDIERLIGSGKVTLS